jgi:hypothetical protein
MSKNKNIEVCWCRCDAVSLVRYCALSLGKVACDLSKAASQLLGQNEEQSEEDWNEVGAAGRAPSRREPGTRRLKTSTHKGGVSGQSQGLVRIPVPPISGRPGHFARQFESSGGGSLAHLNARRRGAQAFMDDESSDITVSAGPAASGWGSAVHVSGRALYAKLFNVTCTYTIYAHIGGP